MSRSPIEDFRSSAAIRHQRRAAAGERIGWVVLTVFIAAAVIGLFGPGPLSDSQSTSPDGSLTVTFQRFLRNGSPTALEVRFPVSGVDGEPRIVLERDYLDAFTVESVLPEPADVTATGTATGTETTFVFVPPTDRDELVVTFSLRPEQYGRRSTRVMVPGHEEARISHLIYP